MERFTWQSRSLRKWRRRRADGSRISLPASRAILSLGARSSLLPRAQFGAISFGGFLIQIEDAGVARRPAALIDAGPYRWSRGRVVVGWTLGHGGYLRRPPPRRDPRTPPAHSPPTPQPPRRA